MMTKEDLYYFDYEEEMRDREYDEVPKISFEDWLKNRKKWEQSQKEV